MPKGFKQEIARISSGSTHEIMSEGEAIVRKAIQSGREPKLDDIKEPVLIATEEIKPVISEEQLLKVAELAANNAVTSLTEKHEQEKKELALQLQEAETKVKEAEELAKNAIALAQEEANQQIAKIEAQKEQAIAQSQEEVAKAKKDRETLEGVFKLTGVQMPNFNTLTNPLKDEPIGAIAELKNLYEGAATHEVVNPATGEFTAQKDLRGLRNQISRHFLELQEKKQGWRNSGFLKDLEISMKNHGFLGGKVTNAAGPTIGTSGSVGAFFLDTLSSLMRETHNQHNIFWQFTVSAFNSAVAPSQNLLVPRWHFLPAPTTISDYELATSSTYTAIAGAIGSSSDSQSLESSTVPITVKEYGLGKGGSIGTRPVYIPEFHQAIALISLLDALDTRLMQNYFAFEELLIRSNYEAATTVLYNKAGEIEATPANIVADDGGTMTEAFANSVYTEMFANKIPAFPDGCYVLVLNPVTANQFKSSLGSTYREVTEEQKMAVTNTFRMATGVEIGHVNGYIGQYCNFHVFVGNSFGVGAAGASPTVTNVTLGVGSTKTLTSFAFGPGCVGRGIALGAEIRASGVNPYGRGESYIWKSHEGVAPMDLDSTLDANQQTRCYKLRTTAVAV